MFIWLRHTFTNAQEFKNGLIFAMRKDLMEEFSYFGTFDVYKAMPIVCSELIHYHPATLGRFAFIKPGQMVSIGFSSSFMCLPTGSIFWGLRHKSRSPGKRQLAEIAIFRLLPSIAFGICTQIACFPILLVDFRVGEE